MFYQKFTVGLVGRPNVGKSTLFNRLIGAKHAIVNDRPGVTRDYRVGNAYIGDFEFQVMDTAGLEEQSSKLAKRMTENSLGILNQLDLILFVIDAQTGVTNDDLKFAKMIRKSSKPILVVVNKAESKNVRHNIQDAYRLGFEEIVGISAAHGEGMADLYENIMNYNEIWLKNNSNNYSDLTAWQNDEESKHDLQIAIVGRPNAGKSTLVNALLGYDRMLTGPEPGITCDAIAIDWNFEGTNIKLIDTAGMRKRTTVTDDLEKLSFSDSERAIQFAQVVVVLMDCNNALEKQDLAIIEKAVEEGRGVVLGFNKIDDIKNKDNFIKSIENEIASKINGVKKIPCVFLSAINKHNIFNLIKEAIRVYTQWQIRVTTAKLNDWLHYALSKHSIPLAKDGRRIKIKYATQHKTRPPSFLLFCNKPEDIDQTYLRYLNKSLVEYFDINATPVRLILRKQKNPYSS
jgi:GTP-binding protein